MAIWVIPGFKRVSKGFQTPPTRFPKGFQLLKPGFLRVSKGFLKAFAMGFKSYQRFFFYCFKAIQTGFLSSKSFETP